MVQRKSIPKEKAFPSATSTEHASSDECCMDVGESVSLTGVGRKPKACKHTVSLPAKPSLHGTVRWANAASPNLRRFKVSTVYACCTDFTPPRRCPTIIVGWHHCKKSILPRVFLGLARTSSSGGPHLRAGSEYSRFERQSRQHVFDVRHFSCCHVKPRANEL